ncbi:MAG: spore germination protein [Lutisporaceae bacterium]
MIKHIKKFSSLNTKKQPSLHEKDSAQKAKNVYNEDELENMQISSSLVENIDRIKNVVGSSTDIIFKNITLGRSEVRPAVIIYIDNLINSQLVDSDVVRPLVLDAYTSGLNTSSEMIEQLQAGNLITRGQSKKAKNFNELLIGVFTGEAGLLIEGINESYVINVKGYKYRNVTESEVEPVVRGPREAFIEVLSVNIGLIRRRLHTTNLVFETFKIGTVGKTNVCMAFIRGICPEGLSNEVRSRLTRIKIDGVLDSGYIEELIQDSPYSIFPQMRNTEKPDVVASSLMEGRVAILVDSTPTVLIAPGEFFSLMQSAEDYYDRYIFSSMIRLLRYLAFIISFLLPALYIAVTTFHQEMIPVGLLESIISARTGVPFPVVIEALGMVFAFEILHEAGVRMPRPIGQAVSIVGALVIGQAAVQANIVSPLMVIVVALTAISKFSIAAYNIMLTVRILRVFFMLIAAVLGMFGIMVGILFLMLHLFSLESFGKPYMSPLSPLRIGDLKDMAIRAPWWAMVRRPAYSTLDSKRMDSGQIPHSTEKKDRRT